MKNTKEQQQQQDEEINEQISNNMISDFSTGKNTDFDGFESPKKLRLNTNPDEDSLEEIQVNNPNHKFNKVMNRDNQSLSQMMISDKVDPLTEINTKNGLAPLNSPDIISIIENYETPKNLGPAFNEYKMRSSLFIIEELLSAELTKIRRYKTCIYCGQFINGKRQGKGIMVHLNGRIYEGDWENDLKHGKGMEISQNGNRYEGDFLNGKPDGIGKFIWINGEIYEGEWKNGLKHGSGAWKSTKGESYVGEWKYGKADGYGIHTWKNGDRYEGEFKECLKHGHGTEKFINGDCYIGNYINGKPNGYGEYYWGSGQIYKGHFKNGLRHGKGVWKKAQGKADKYDGEWSNDKKCGYGEYYWESGNYYKGNYFNDMRHGYGEMYWIDGSNYKGIWEKGIQNGEGELTAPGKPKKIGIFKNNVFIESNEDSEQQTLETNVSPYEVPVKLKYNLRELKRSKTTNKERPLNIGIEGNNQTHIIEKTSKFSVPNIRPIDEKRDAATNTKQINPTKHEVTKGRNSPSPTKKIEEIPDTKCLLTMKELHKWNSIKDKLRINPDRYRDLGNAETCDKIRKLINPPVWIPGGRDKLASGKSELINGLPSQHLVGH